MLLPALGGETGDGFALIEDGGTALVELEDDGALTGERLAAAAASGAAVVLLAAAGAQAPDEGDAADALLAAIAEHGGLGGAALVVLCDVRAPDALAERLRDERGARLVAGAPFVLEALNFDTRMRAARAVIVGERRLERGTLQGRRRGRDRDPCAPVRRSLSRRRRESNAIDRFDARILDLQTIIAATTIAELEAAGEALAARL